MASLIPGLGLEIPLSVQSNSLVCCSPGAFVYLDNTQIGKKDDKEGCCCCCCHSTCCHSTPTEKKSKEEIEMQETHSPQNKRWLLQKEVEEQIGIAAAEQILEECDPNWKELTQTNTALSKKDISFIKKRCTEERNRQVRSRVERKLEENFGKQGKEKILSDSSRTWRKDTETAKPLKLTVYKKILRSAVRAERKATAAALSTVAKRKLAARSSVLDLSFTAPTQEETTVPLEKRMEALFFSLSSVRPEASASSENTLSLVKKELLSQGKTSLAEDRTIVTITESILAKGNGTAYTPQEISVFVAIRRVADRLFPSEEYEPRY